MTWGGAVDLEHQPDGLIATLRIPAAMTDPRLIWRPRPQAPRVGAAVGGAAATAVRSALVVEDNFMIALQMQALLERLGVTDTVIAPSVATAEDELAARSFDLHLLDIDLGDGGTSIALAQTLVDQGAWVVFTSGYGEQADLPDGLRALPVLSKPYDPASLALVLQRVRAA